MKILKTRCKYCEKLIESPYENQLKQNLEAHESSCKKNPKNKEGDKNDKKK